MKVLHVNTFDRGGAAIACQRLHDGLLRIGVESNLLVRHRTKTRSHVHQFMPGAGRRMSAKIQRIMYELKLAKDPVKDRRELWKAEFLSQLPEGSEYFSFPDTRFDVTQSPYYKNADIINLHWVADFVDYQSFFKSNRRPVVWTLHDMAAFRGGMHYEQQALGLDESGNLVPRKFEKSLTGIVNQNMAVAKAAIKDVENLTIVTPSNWLGNESSKSSVFGRFPHKVIPYGIDSGIYKPLDQHYSRNVLGIDPDATVILFVADSLTNFRKGFALLKAAIASMNKDSKIVLCAIGSGPNEQGSADSNILYLGRLEDERIMAVAYNAADVFVIPSIEDNLPNTVLEAHMCGLPVIGFPVGGVNEMIQDQVNGLLCDEVNVSALSAAIGEFLAIKKFFSRDAIHSAAISRYELSLQAKSYLALYNSIGQRGNIH